MATLISKATGNFTAAGTWAVADTTTLSDSEASSSVTTTSFVNTPALVPGAITIDAISLKINTLAASPTGTFATMIGKNGSISSVSVANPTTITTSAPHGLVSGEAIIISGTNTLTSTVGSFTATVTGANTFTIPVNVTSVTTGTGLWASVRATILSNTSAASTVITTSLAHGLTTGTTITIKGSTASPSLNGSYAVTVLTSTTFSIPVNTTGGGFASGTGYYNINAVADTLCVINTADLGVNGMFGWATFKLAAPVTLTASVQYDVRITASASTVSVMRTSTASDWSRMLRTTTTQAPAAGDNLNICGEYTGLGTSNTLTVTMDNTAATVFGKIETSGKGTLAYGTAASTNYQLIGGNSTNNSFYINGSGVVQIGTSGTPMPTTSTALLQINQNAVTVTNGILLRGNGTLTTFGKTVTQKAFLAADASAASTSLTSDISTGWKSGDLIALASTTTTSAQSETKVLTADASGTSLTITALTNAHSGTGATKGEIANLTRNVKISGQSTSLNSYINLGADAIFNCNYTEVFNMGSSTSNKRGVDVGTIGGSLSVDNCVWRDFTVGSNFGFLVNTSTNANISITNTTFYNLSTALALNSVLTTATTITVDNVLAILSNLTFNAQAATVTNITNVSGTVVIGVTTPLAGLTINNIISHSAPATGISLSGLSQNMVSMSNLTCWRCAVRGISITGSSMFIDGMTTFGNLTYGLELNQCAAIEINNYTANAGTTSVQPSGVNLTNGTTKIKFTNSSFGATTTFATGDVTVSAANFNEVYFLNCLFASTTEVSSQGSLHTNSILSSIEHDQTTGVHKIWKRYGTITADSTINATAPLSQRLTPNSATYKLITNNKTFAIPSGKTAKLTVGIRRSVAGDGTAYNGNLPNLWLRSNNSAGISTDTLLATASAASLGAWEYISGTIPASTSDTVNSIYIDCDGTAGWVNVDVWKLEIINGSAMGTNVNGEDYFQDGVSFAGLNTLILLNTGNETFWINDGVASETFPISAIDTGKFFHLF